MREDNESPDEWTCLKTHSEVILVSACVNPT